MRLLRTLGLTGVLIAPALAGGCARGKGDFGPTVVVNTTQIPAYDSMNSDCTQPADAAVSVELRNNFFEFLSSGNLCYIGAKSCIRLTSGRGPIPPPSAGGTQLDLDLTGLYFGGKAYGLVDVTILLDNSYGNVDFLDATNDPDPDDDKPNSGTAANDYSYATLRAGATYAPMFLCRGQVVRTNPQQYSITLRVKIKTKGTPIKGHLNIAIIAKDNARHLLLPFVIDPSVPNKG